MSPVRCAREKGVESYQREAEEHLGLLWLSLPLSQLAQDRVTRNREPERQRQTWQTSRKGAGSAQLHTGPEMSNSDRGR